MPQDRAASTSKALRLPQESLEQINRYTARLEGELHLSVSRSDALRRLFTNSVASVRGPITLFACLVLLDRSYNKWQINLITAS